MDLKTRIKVALGLDEETTEKKEVQLMFEGKLVDGTIVVSEADEVAPGAVMNILSEDGVQTPMPEGTYQLEGGVSFTVDAEGVVLEVSEEVEAEDEDDMEKDKEYMETHAELFTEVGNVVKELLEEVKNDIGRISAELDELRGENLAKDENIAELQEENTNLSAQVKELNESPATEPVKVSKFSEAKNTKKLSDVEYRQLSRQEKYWYNLNN